MNELGLSKPCPSCKKEGSVQIHLGQVRCRDAECDFWVSYRCPICREALKPEHFYETQTGYHFACPSCKNHIPVKKIHTLLENGLIVDYTLRCPFCNGPTIHRKDMNLSNRCFFYPKCSGQADLFGNTRESLTFLDFETTGLEQGKDFIIEIGAIKIDEEGFEQTFQTFIKPPLPLTPYISKLTGISNEMLDSAPLLKPSLEKLISFIGGSKLVAHNADFDILWLTSSALQHQISLNKTAIICTFKWAKKHNEPHCSLNALTKKYDIRHVNAHRALADAVSTRELFFIYENFRKFPRPLQYLDEFEEASQKIIEKYNACFQP